LKATLPERIVIELYCDCMKAERACGQTNNADDTPERVWFSGEYSLLTPEELVILQSQHVFKPA
jgi:hypothetical protein